MPENQENQVDDTVQTTEIQPEYTIKIADDTPERHFLDPIEETVEEEKVETETVEEKKVEETIAEEVVETPKPELNDELAIAYVKEKLGLDINSLDDLKPKERKILNPEVEKFIEFSDKTGNHSYQDFLETQKDWTKESADVAIKQLMKLENPNLTNDEIEHRFKRKYGYDADLDDETEIKDKQIDLKVEQQRALNVLEARKKEFEVNRGSDDFIPTDYKEAKKLVDELQLTQKEAEVKYAQSRDEYVAQTENVFTQNFEGFKVNVGDSELTIKPENLAETKKSQLDIDNFTNKFFDPKTGKLLDPQGFHKAMYFAMNVDAVTKQIYNSGKAAQAEADEKISKNIVTDTIRKVPSQGSSGITVKEVKD